MLHETNRVSTARAREGETTPVRSARREAYFICTARDRHGEDPNTGGLLEEASRVSKADSRRESVSLHSGNTSGG